MRQSCWFLSVAWAFRTGQDARLVVLDSVLLICNRTVEAGSRHFLSEGIGAALTRYATCIHTHIYIYILIIY